MEAKTKYGTTGEVEDEGTQFRVRSKDGKRAWAMEKQANQSAAARWAAETAEAAEATRLLWEHLQQHRRNEEEALLETRRRVVMEEAGLGHESYGELDPATRKLVDLVVSARFDDREEPDGPYAFPDLFPGLKTEPRD